MKFHAPNRSNNIQWIKIDEILDGRKPFGSKNRVCDDSVEFERFFLAMVIDESNSKKQTNEKTQSTTEKEALQRNYSMTLEIAPFSCS